jgi:peptidoglycan/LPS O-acetylase OafA/YrhL
LREKQKHGDISLRLFYVRRALRILPAYVAFLIVIGTIALFAPLEISGSSWFALIAYLVNFMEVPKVADHVWSLSVEEQFYLLWPFFFWFFLVKQSRPSRALATLFIPIILGPICRHLGAGNPHSVLFGEHSFFTHFDSLAYGCLLAFSFGFRAKQIESLMENRKGSVFIGGLLLILIPHFLIVIGELQVLTIPLASSLSAFGIALMIGFVLFHPSFFAVSWLEWKPIALVGVWSYSIYLWQQIYCSPPESFTSAPRFFVFPYWLVPVFATAIASYYLVEKPFLRLKSKVGSRK